MEVIWKAVSGVVNCWIGAAVCFHDNMHGFRAGRGAGTASIEFKILHKLANMREEVLYKVLLNL